MRAEKGKRVKVKKTRKRCTEREGENKTPQGLFVNDLSH